MKCESEGINFEVRNRIFEILPLKTTKITVSIDKEGSKINTELRDEDTLIYNIEELNPFKLLYDIQARIFYLNKAAKLTFSQRMGLNTRDFGSIFLYKNKIRIFPFGEPNEDTLQLDKRKSQKPSIYIGNKDLIGIIEINGSNKQFIETSSRGDGFIKNETYSQFLAFILENIVV